MNMFFIVFKKIIFITVFFFQIVNTLLFLFRLIQMFSYRKKKHEIHILTVSSGVSWLIFILSIISSIAVLGNLLVERNTDVIIIVGIFIVGHIFCTYLIVSQLFFRIEFSGNTVTVYKILKQYSFNRQDVRLQERRLTVYLLSGEKKLVSWDCRLVNFEEEANLYRFILNGK